jgi:CCR4-NOT transcription complex subunit 4
LAQAASAAAIEAKQASEAAISHHNLLKADADNAAREAARRADTMQTAAKVASAADEAAKSATERVQQAKIPADAAAQTATRANAEYATAANAEKAALAAMQAAAATQPKSETLPPITTPDIAAFAQIVGETDAAKKLFCRGAYTVGEPAQPQSTSGVAPLAAVPAVVAPVATDTAAATAKAEPATGTVPSPATRPSAPRRPPLR